MDKPTRDALHRILKDASIAEYKHYVESGKPDDHIFKYMIGVDFWLMMQEVEEMERERAAELERFMKAKFSPGALN